MPGDSTDGRSGLKKSYAPPAMDRFVIHGGLRVAFFGFTAGARNTITDVCEAVGCDCRAIESDRCESAREWNPDIIVLDGDHFQDRWHQEKALLAGLAPLRESSFLVIGGTCGHALRAAMDAIRWPLWESLPSPTTCRDVLHALATASSARAQRLSGARASAARVLAGGRRG